MRPGETTSVFSLLRVCCAYVYLYRFLIHEYDFYLSIWQPSRQYKNCDPVFTFWLGNQYNVHKDVTSQRFASNSIHITIAVPNLNLVSSVLSSTTTISLANHSQLSIFLIVLQSLTHRAEVWGDMPAHWFTGIIEAHNVTEVFPSLRVNGWYSCYAMLRWLI